MSRKFTVYFALALLGLGVSLSIPKPAGAQSVFVSELNSGNVIKVDASGTKTIFATGLGRPGPLKFDKNGNLFVIDFEGRLMKVTPDGSVSTFATGLPEGSLNDLLVTADGKPFLLVAMENPVNGDMYGAVWELVEGGVPSLLASTMDEAPPGKTGRGFTCGPGGHFYLAMQGGNSGGRIIRITRDGQMSTFFDPGLPPFNQGGGHMIDVRFNSQGEMLILGHVPPGNTRIIWKVQNGALTTFVSPGGIPDQSLQLTINAADNLFVSGGGFGGCAPSQTDCFEGFVKRVDPSGNVTTLATFPPPAGELMNTIIDIDDDGFDSFLPTTVEAGGPYDVNEGAAVLVTASGNDPNGGPLTYAWDLDNNGSFETSGQSVIFSAASIDGPSNHTINVQVTDNSGGTATDQARVNVVNVAPTATFTGTPGTIIVGQSVTLAFSNPSDPSAADVTAGFTYSFDCTNDGVFEVSDVTVNSYACAYPASGTFAAKGRIKDKDGDFNDYTVHIFVQTPQAAAGSLIDQVQALVDAGLLNGGQGNSLISKLEAAIKQLDKGNTTPAINQLQAFINEVNAFMNSTPPILTPAEGQPLIDAANAIIAALSATGKAAQLNSGSSDAMITTEGALPAGYRLEQNSPNPFNPTTTISFALPEASDVALSIFNTNGQLVKKLVAGEMSAGRHNLVWDATDAHGQRVASGVYLYVLKAGEFVAQRKLVLMK